MSLLCACEAAPSCRAAHPCRHDLRHGRVGRPHRLAYTNHRRGGGRTIRHNMGAAASVERALAAAPDQLSRAAREELAARHGVAVKDSPDVLGAGNGTVAGRVAALLPARRAAHGTWAARRRRGRPRPRARRPARSCCTLFAAGASRRSARHKGSSRLSDGSIDTLAKGSSRLSNGTMDGVARRRGEVRAPPRHAAQGEGRARGRRRRDGGAISGAGRRPCTSAAPRGSRVREEIEGIHPSRRRRDAHPHGLDRHGEEAGAARSIESSGRALASLEELPEVEKRCVRNQGILLIPPENLVKRKIREDPRVENILGKWWAASLRYDDKDATRV